MSSLRELGGIMIKILFSLFSVCLISQNAWSLGAKPKTPQDKAIEKIRLLQAVAATSWATRISIPVPKAYVDPIIFEEQGAQVELQLKKVKFEKLVPSGLEEPVEGDPAEYYESTLRFGLFAVEFELKINYNGLRLKTNASINVEPLTLPMNLYVTDPTTIEVTPPDRAHEVFVGDISLSIKNIPNFIDRAISRMFRDQMAQAIAESIPHFILEIPDIPRR